MFCKQRLSKEGFSKNSWLVPAVLIFTSFLGVTAFAADNVKGNVPFPFLIGTTAVPAGMYEFAIDRVNETVTVKGAKNTKSIGFVTVLAAKAQSTATDADVVFDKVGETYSLSEIWMPGAEGVLVHATKGKHEHNILHLMPAALRNDNR